MAKRRETVLPEHSRCHTHGSSTHFEPGTDYGLLMVSSQSVLLLLAKCCIRAGTLLNDEGALEEALHCADDVIKIGSDIEHGKLLRIQALIMLQRWGILSIKQIVRESKIPANGENLPTDGIMWKK